MSEPARLVGRLVVAVGVVAAVVALVLVSSRAEPPSPPAAQRATGPDRTTTSSSPCPGGGGAEVDDSADGDFASHFTNTGGPGLVEGAEQPRVVDGPGGPAMGFAVPGGGKRSEVRPAVPADREGTDRWVHDVSTLRGVPTGTDTWQVVLQWHQAASTGSPPIALEVGAGQLRLANEGGDQQSLGPLGPDDTIDVVLHVVFSTDPARGRVDVWRDGRPVLTGYHPPGGTMLDERDYLKVGIYRDPEIAQPSSMLLRRLAVGPTSASVGGPGGAC